MKKTALFVLPLLAACGGDPEVRRVSHDEAVSLAKGAAVQAFQTLSGELGKAFTTGGAPAAIDVCSSKATELLGQVASERGLGMSRISDRPRNPEHAASSADLAAITTFRETVARGETPTPAVEDLDDGSTVVRLPIVLNQPLCLKCHGGESDIEPATLASIRRFYPDDRATGYQLNDVRGIWRVSVPPAGAR